MTPKDMAIQLIDDSIQLQPPHYDFTNCYETAKLNALYIALAVRRTHENQSKEYKYYLEVKHEIEKL